MFKLAKPTVAACSAWAGDNAATANLAYLHNELGQQSFRAATLQQTRYLGCVCKSGHHSISILSRTILVPTSTWRTTCGSICKHPHNGHLQKAHHVHHSLPTKNAKAGAVHELCQGVHSQLKNTTSKLAIYKLGPSIALGLHMTQCNTANDQTMIR